MPRKGEGIRRRSDGRFEGRYIISRDENGKAKYRSVYGKSEREVRQKLREGKVSRGMRKEEPESFGSRAEQWLRERKDSISENTYDRYEELLERHVMPEYGKLSIREAAEHNAAKQFAEQDTVSSIGSGTAQMCQNIVHSILAYAQEKEAKIQTKTRTDRKHYQALTEEEMKSLCFCAKEHRGIIMLAALFSLYCGIHTGELCALSWNDVNLRERSIYVWSTVTRVRNRTQETSASTVLQIAEHGRKGQKRKVLYPTVLSEYVEEFYCAGMMFLNGTKDTPGEPRTLNNRIKAMLASYGLEDVTIQRLVTTYRMNLADESIACRYLEEDEGFSQNALHVKRSGGWDRCDAVSDSEMERLQEEMREILLPLRKLAGLSRKEMGELLGISAGSYGAVESGRRKLNRSMYLALLYFFEKDPKTRAVITALSLYPTSINQRR